MEKDLNNRSLEIRAFGILPKPLKEILTDIDDGNFCFSNKEAFEKFSSRRVGATTLSELGVEQAFPDRHPKSVIFLPLGK